MHCIARNDRPSRRCGQPSRCVAGKRKTAPIISVRGVPGGWRDPWDSPGDNGKLRAKAEAAERYQLVTAEHLGVV